MEYKRLKTIDSAGTVLSVDDTRTVASSKATRLALVRQTAREGIEALGLDWMVVREVSGGQAIPETVKVAAANIRTESNSKEAWINAFAKNAENDDDKAACDLIETIGG